MSKDIKDLDARSQALLRELIERYLRDGQPVGSTTLAKSANVNFSPATIRNVMAELEHIGLLASPHTSAGRIPTSLGIRCFVDTLLTVKPAAKRDVNEVKSQLNSTTSSPALVEAASDALSRLTQLAGVVTMPSPNQQSIDQVEFVKLSGQRVLAILVMQRGEVQNRILQTKKEFSKKQLREAANYLNAQFSGRTILDVRDRLLKDMDRAQKDMNQGMLSAVNMAHQMFDADQKRENMVLSGESNLMAFDDLSNIDTLRQLFSAFNQKRDILHLLDQSLTADGVKLFIGDESGYQMLDGCSVVTAPYTADDQVVGVLGVIGPTRMAYERVIPIVDVTAKLLSASLSSGR